MFLGLAVFLVIGTILAFLALRAIHELTFGRSNRRQQAAPEKKQPEPEKKKSPSESKAESQKRQLEKQVPEGTKRRYAASLFNGISEAFFEGETSFRIDEKATASECIARSALSFIEYENKDLAGDDFFGFNLFVAEDSWMVLTYNGCAVATLTKEERETTAIINGETVKGSLPAYRTNTFPPELREGMVVSDLEKMLEASERIKKCYGDPEQVSAIMKEYFTRGDNISRLKGAIDRKIQSKVSLRKGKEPSQQQSPKRPRKLGI